MNEKEKIQWQHGRIYKKILRKDISFTSSSHNRHLAISKDKGKENEVAQLVLDSFKWDGMEYTYARECIYR